MRSPTSHAAALRLQLLLLASLALSGASIGAEVKRVAIIYGPASHGWDEHEFPAGATLLADSLNQSGLGIEAQAIDGWPDEPSALLQADAIALYSDGLEAHVAQSGAEELTAAREEGAGIAVLHFALEAPAPDHPLQAFLLESIGGVFEADWSVNPVWQMEQPILAEHPITRGVAPFSLRDEWYFHLRFQEDEKTLTPVLQALPPPETLGADGPRSGNPAVRDALARGQPQTLAWTKTDARGRRGFGLTGGHFHSNWSDDDFRRFVLNALAWTAGVEIPADGLASQVLPIPRTRSLEEAIARGALEDIGRHLDREPEALDRAGRSGRAPIQLAVMRNKPEVAELLLERGADPSVTTASGETLLHLAVGRNSPIMADLLLRYPADLDAWDKTGWTVWHHAAARNSVELVELFAARGYRPNRLSERGGTPLHEAAVQGGAELIRGLIQLGVDPRVVSADGRTALDIAIEYENATAIELLEPLSSTGGERP